MRMAHASALLLLAAAASLASPPEGPTPPEIRLPLIEVEAPKPPPSTVSRLAENQLYVIDSDVEIDVLASPEGVVSVAFEKGPVKIRGVFVENTSGRPSTRTYKGPYVYTVEAVSSGRVELLIVRKDGKGKVIRRTLDVTVGPPKPDPDPKPPGPNPPGPNPPAPAKSLRVFIVFESQQQLTSSQKGIVYGKVVEDWLNANCTGGKAGWRRRDKDSPGELDAAMSQFWDATKSHITTTPCLAVEVTREGSSEIKVDIIPLEATPAAMVSKLQSYKGK